MLVHLAVQLAQTVHRVHLIQYGGRGRLLFLIQPLSTPLAVTMTQRWQFIQGLPSIASPKSLLMMIFLGWVVLAKLAL